MPDQAFKPLGPHSASHLTADLSHTHTQAHGEGCPRLAGSSSPPLLLWLSPSSASIAKPDLCKQTIAGHKVNRLQVSPPGVSVFEILQLTQGRKKEEKEKEITQAASSKEKRPPRVKAPCIPSTRRTEKVKGDQEGDEQCSIPDLRSVT